MMLHEAIYALYPEVVSIHEETAYDVEGSEFEYDLDDVNAKVKEMEAEAETIAQAKISTHQSALNKLIALGLTEEEALALGVK